MSQIWNTAQNTEDKREKIQALSLAKECYSMKIELLAYIRDFDRIVEMTTTAQELYYKMLELYPNRVNPGWALWSSARAVKQ
jgi:hypothetical protein